MLKKFKKELLHFLGKIDYFSIHPFHILCNIMEMIKGKVEEIALQIITKNK